MNDRISLRDFFAAKAISGMAEFDGDAFKIAEWAYEIADAMIKARNEEAG